MALYALDGETPVFSMDANPRMSYRCLQCKGPVKIRRGRNRIPHFYHLQSAVRCHLYSKSEDHLILQLQIQDQFPKEEIVIEHPFFEIQRIADIIWEKKKIIFEIQCSKIDPFEAAQRIIDYRKLGYEIVWLLDDRMFNKKIMRPAESFMRAHNAYFFSFHRGGATRIYDQCEVIVNEMRWKKGFQSKVHLLYPRKMPEIEWPSYLPTLIEHRTHEALLYFYGDMIYRSLQSCNNLAIAEALQRWKEEEVILAERHKPPNRVIQFLKKYLLDPYESFLCDLIEKI